MSPTPPTDPTPAEPERSIFEYPPVPVDLRRDGLLWWINTAIFHPLGYALALDPSVPCELLLLGDGSSPVHFGYEPGELDRLGSAANTALARARQAAAFHAAHPRWAAPNHPDRACGPHTIGHWCDICDWPDTHTEPPAEPTGILPPLEPEPGGPPC